MGVGGVELLEVIAVHDGGVLGFVDLLVVDNVGNGHSVASESSGFIGADDGDGSESFDDFEVLDQDTYLEHSLGGESQGDGHLRKETFGDVGDHDTDEEDDGLDDRVAGSYGQDEENDTQSQGDASHDVNESVDFLLDESVRSFDGGGEFSDVSEESTVSSRKDNASSVTRSEVAPGSSDILSLIKFLVISLRTKLNIDIFSS